MNTNKQTMKKIFLLFFFITIYTTYSQTPKKSKLPDWNSNISQQFKEVYSKSGKYQEYKVIKATWFNRLQKHVLDTLSTLKNQIAEQENKISSLQNEINSLNKKIADRDEVITDLKTEKDSIQFFGSNISKATYNMILWFIIVILSLGLALFVYRYLHSNAVTKETLDKYKELSEEYQGFRTRSLEREQSLKRQLIDEINKHNA